MLSHLGQLPPEKVGCWQPGMMKWQRHPEPAYRLLAALLRGGLPPQWTSGAYAIFLGVGELRFENALLSATT